MSNSKLFAPRMMAALMGAAVVAGSACAPVTPSAATGAAATMATGARLTDPEIATTLMTANRGEIEEAQLALSKTQNPALRQAAERIITDHTASNQRITQILQQMNASPSENALSRQIQENHLRAMESLRAANGMAFDHAYLQRQMTVHRYLIDTVDSVLLPSARTQPVRAELALDRPALATHLQMSEQAMSTMGH